MSGSANISILSFLLIYLLLIVVLVLMRKSKIAKTRELLIASLRMTAQLVLVGFILTYILQNPHPALTAAFISAMVVFSLHRVLSRQKKLNFKFRVVIGASFCISGLAVLTYFILAVLGQSLANPQYTIPLAGMILGQRHDGHESCAGEFRRKPRRPKTKNERPFKSGRPSP